MSRKNLLMTLKKARVKVNDNPSSETLVSQLERLEAELNKILDFETKGLMIRSRARWMEDGEKSSKYFCNLEKRSNEKKCIYKVKKDNGNVVSNQSHIMEEIHHYL